MHLIIRQLSGELVPTPLIRHGFAVPPSPEGEGFGALLNCNFFPLLA